mgnify:CR=1 FL=1
MQNLGSRIREAVCAGYGGVDSYDFHALETIQCMVERRKGGETGVKWIQAYRGESFYFYFPLATSILLSVLLSLILYLFRK